MKTLKRPFSSVKPTESVVACSVLAAYGRRTWTQKGKGARKAPCGRNFIPWVYGLN